jgi:hypothetical protein
LFAISLASCYPRARVLPLNYSPACIFVAHANYTPLSCQKAALSPMCDFVVQIIFSLSSSPSRPRLLSVVNTIRDRKINTCNFCFATKRLIERELFFCNPRYSIKFQDIKMACSSRFWRACNKHQIIIACLAFELWYFKSVWQIFQYVSMHCKSSG